MKVTGEATLRATVSEVYAALNDPAILVRTIPGCRRLEQVGDDAYRATVVAGVASIKGTFDGDVRLSDQDAPHSFTLHASGAGAPGTVVAVAKVALSPAEDGATLLRYDADATIGGVIGGVGQRMLASVAKKTAAEFFAAVERELTLAPVPAAPAPAGPAPAAPGAARPGAAGAAGAAGPGTEPVLIGAPSSTENVNRVPLLTGQGGVWTAPVPAVDPARQRMRDVLLGAAIGAAIALLGVLIGAIVAGW